VSASYGTVRSANPALRRNVASSVVALLAALTVVVFILGRGPGTLVWFNGSSPTWLPFAGSGLSWLPFGHSGQATPPDPGTTPPAQLPATSPSPDVSPAPSPSASASPAATPTPTPTATPTPTPTAAPTPTPTAAPAPAPAPAPTPTPTPAPTQAPGPLSASASASPSQGMAPLTVNFSGSASGGSGGYVYYWDFGDGSMTTGQTQQHVYPQLGIYSAILTVEDSATATATTSVLVQVSLGLTISATPSSGLASLNVSLDGAATGGVAPYSYSWDFGDGATAGPLTAAAQAHTYGLPGSFTARLTVTDANSATATDAIAIVAQQPVPTVGGVSPNAGPESGGTAVTITGTWLTNATAVVFGSHSVAIADLGTPACDQSGNCTLTVASPAGRAGPVNVRVTTSGGTSAIGNDQFTYLLAWSAVAATSPTAREGAAMVNDGSGVLMFGGVSGTTLLNETWYWNGSGWTQVTTPLGLVARSNAAIAYNGSKVVLFGGACGVPVATTTCYLNDTWTWDPGTKTWSAVTGSTQPSARAGAMLAKDAGGKLFLWGGRDATGYLADAYTYSGTPTAWSPKSQGPAPAPRAFGSMATDASGQVILFGGYSAALGYQNDTWKWTGSAWSKFNTLAQPTPRKMASFAYFNKPNGGTASGLAIFGGQDGSGDLGDTWTWNGTNWSPLYAAGAGQPPVRSDAMAATDTNGAIVLFGGTSSGTQLNDLWRLS